MHDSLLADIHALRGAGEGLQSAAPLPMDRGWDGTRDRAAIEAAKEQWKAARTAYEYSEGALAPLFPDLDASLDARYDDFLAGLPRGDDRLFDDQGVVGLHAIERILYADRIPPRITAFEAKLDFYQRPHFRAPPKKPHNSTTCS